MVPEWTALVLAALLLAAPRSRVARLWTGPRLGVLCLAAAAWVATAPAAWSPFFRTACWGASAVTAFLATGSRPSVRWRGWMVAAAAGLGCVCAAERPAALVGGMGVAWVALVGLLAGKNAGRKPTEAAVKAALLGAFSWVLVALGAGLGAFGGGARFAVAAALMLAGVLGWLAAVPWHPWMADVFEAAPSALCVQVAVGWTAAGVAVIGGPQAQGMASTDGLPSLGPVVGAASLLLGYLGALGQLQFRRLLAYSRIAHGGYLLLALSSPHPDGRALAVFLSGVLFTLHAGALAVAAAVERREGAVSLHELRGLAHRSPLLCAGFAVCLLGLAGAPPLAGFAALGPAAWETLGGALSAPGARLGVLLVGALLALACFGRVLGAVYAEVPRKPVALDAPVAHGVVLFAAALLALWGGLAPDVFWRAARRVARQESGPTGRVARARNASSSSGLIDAVPSFRPGAIRSP